MNPTMIQNSDHKIVRFTNISYFNFTSEMGAMYGGVPYFVSAGESRLMPLSVGDHLATHLARQIILQKAPTRDEKELDGKGSDRKLWDDDAIRQLKSKIISEEYEEERKAPVSEAELMKHRIDDLNKAFPPENVAVSIPGTSGTPGVSGTANVYKDKAEVIAELQKRNIKFDARKTKANLEELLK